MTRMTSCSKDDDSAPGRRLIMEAAGGFLQLPNAPDSTSPFLAEEHFFERSSEIRTRGHSYKFQKFCRSFVRTRAFSQRVVDC